MHVDGHKPGSFRWIELGTTDQNAAKTFYGELFGWGHSDSPIGPDQTYTIFKIDGRDCAAGYTLEKDKIAQGIPPHWMIYVAVENADDAVKKVEVAGGKILAGAFDVMEHGRMAVVQDPAGAALCAWQAKKHSGLGIANVPVRSAGPT